MSIVDGDEDPTPDNLVRLLRQQWNKVRLLDTDGWVDRNAVIAAGAVTKLKKPTVLMPPRTGAKKAAPGTGRAGLARDTMSLKKRSFTLSGHRTSVALEAEFWAVIDDAALKQRISLAALVAKIDASPRRTSAGQRAAPLCAGGQRRLAFRYDHALSRAALAGFALHFPAGRVGRALPARASEHPARRRQRRAGHAQSPSARQGAGHPRRRNHRL